MTTKSMLVEHRSRLERRANVIRTRLLHTVQTLDARRHQIAEIGHHARRLAFPVGASLVGIAVLAAGATFGIRALVVHRREQHLGYRLSKSIERLRREPRPPFWKEALRKMAIAALGVVASELVKRAAKKMVRRPPELPPPSVIALPATAAGPLPLLAE